MPIAGTVTLLLLVLSIVDASVKIKCHSCITPWNGANFDMICAVDKYCEGFWCTKGPDSRSNGILHGCSDVVPLEKATSTCKAVNASDGLYFNCYCNNMDYCNDSTNYKLFNVLLFALYMFFR